MYYSEEEEFYPSEEEISYSYFQEESEEEDIYKYIALGEEEEFKPSYKDLSRISMGGIGTGFIGESKVLKDPMEIALATSKNIIFTSNNYIDIRDNIKNESFNFIMEIPEKKMLLYNVEILVSAVIYMTQYNNIIDPENIQNFLRKTRNLHNINLLDFIRYIRILS